jgi:uroporphyrinogen-III synthase
MLDLMVSQPLAGLNILITRPREQAGELVQRIARAGGNPILFPLLEIFPVHDSPRLTELVARLREFDLAIFISPNAVRYGIAAIGGSAALPAHLKIATVGQGSAKALRELGLREIIAPSDRFDSEALLALPELHQVAGSRVIIFRGDGGRELLGDTLKARGAEVEYAECYRRSRPQQSATALQGKIDAITITSSEALANLWDMLDSAMREKFAAIPLFAPHERIAATARQLGWRNVVPTASGDEGLVEALLAWAGARR